MRSTLVCLFIASLAGAASAQPGQTPPVVPDPGAPPPPPAGVPVPAPYPPPPPSPYPEPPPAGYGAPPPGYAPAPYQYVPVQLTEDEQKLLARGEITDGQHIGGGIASLFLGLGVGQAIQGRWSDTGWIFTLGETAAFAGLIIATGDCIESGCDDGDGETLIIASAIGYFGLRVWEAIDAFATPPQHNRKVRELRMRLGMPVPMYTRVVPYVHRSRDGGGVAGVGFRF